MCVKADPLFSKYSKSTEKKQAVSQNKLLLKLKTNGDQPWKFPKQTKSV